MHPSLHDHRNTSSTLADVKLQLTIDVAYYTIKTKWCTARSGSEDQKDEADKQIGQLFQQIEDQIRKMNGPKVSTNSPAKAPVRTCSRGEFAML